jgi:DNA polymerase III delta subunit
MVKIHICLREAHRELKKTEYSKIERINLDGDKISPEDFIDIINANSLFSSDRVIFIKRLYRNKEKDLLLSFLLEYFEKRNTNTSIIIWEDQKIRSTTKYLKYFQKNKALEESPDLNKRTFLTWAHEEVKNNNIELNNNLVKLLSERIIIILKLFQMRYRN